MPCLYVSKNVAAYVDSHFNSKIKKMPKQAKKKVSTKKRSTQKSKVLESITGADALEILKVLAKRHEDIEKEIESIANELLGHVDADDVAASVQMNLEFLDVEDVWDRAGPKRDGYVDTRDAAWEMFEEALQPFRDDVDKYKQLSMLEEAESICHGLLKGIYDFDKESATEYKDWAADIPSDYFDSILDDWKKLYKGRLPLSGMKKFLHTHCPDWAESTMKSLRSRKL